MIPPHFTVLLPINRPPAMLPFAIRSVLAQQGVELELFVICDGAPEATLACAKAFAEQDPRIRVFAHDKGERHGEAYRHQALQYARGTFVAQIGDDDLWFPNHLITLARLLDRVDFGNLLQADVAEDGAIFVHDGDLEIPQIRHRMLDGPFNFFGPSVAGYRLDAYRRLPVGWSPAPADLWTDLYMWRKFLSQQDLLFGTSFTICGMKLSAQTRHGMALTDRAAEVAKWASLLADPEEIAAFIEHASRSLFHRREAAQAVAATDYRHSSTALLELQVREKALKDESEGLRAELAAGAANAARLAAVAKAEVDAALLEQQTREKALRDECEGLRAELVTGAANAARLAAEAKAEVDGLTSQLDVALAENHALQTSISWRLTQPLRWFKARTSFAAANG